MESPAHSSSDSDDGVVQFNRTHVEVPLEEYEQFRAFQDRIDQVNNDNNNVGDAANNGENNGNDGVIVGAAVAAGNNNNNHNNPHNNNNNRNDNNSMMASLIKAQKPPHFPAAGTSATAFIRKINVYFSMLQRTGGAIEDDIKIGLVILSTTGAAETWCNDYSERLGRIRTWQQFCADFVKQHTPPSEQKELLDILNKKLKPSFEHPMLYSAIDDYNTKYKTIKLELVDISSDVYILMYRAALPPFLMSVVDAHLHTHTSTGKKVTLEALMDTALLLAPSQQNNWYTFRGRSAPLRERHYGSRGQQQPRNDTSRAAAVRSRNDDNNNERDVHAHALHSKRRRDDGRNTFWEERIKPYCMKHSLCFRCKQPLNAPNHNKRTCQHVELTEEDLSKNTRGQ